MSEPAEAEPDPADSQRDAEPSDASSTEAAGDALPEDAPRAPPPELDDERIVPAGNPLRWRGLVPLLAGVLSAFLLMALTPQFRFGVPLGALGILVATLGVLDLLGTFDDPVERVAHRVTLRGLAPAAALFGAGLLALFVLVCLAVAGTTGALVSAIAIPSAFLTVVVGLYRLGDGLGAWSAGDDGAPIPLHRRHGFQLVALTTLLYLPMLGSHGLSDPWETHYGEVAREILARNDWISLWWAQDGWFWSKPILDFWLQALSMATFGVRWSAGGMLSAAQEGREPWPEWAVRLPIFLLALLATYLLYKAVARVFGRRAGLFAGVVLMTMPQWFLLTQQTMTDMPFVACLTAAMALLVLGATEDPEREVRVTEIAVGCLRLRVSGYHLVVGAIVAFALPQVLYLLSRHVPIDTGPLHVAFRADTFQAGSAGNCGLPGNDPCKAFAPVAKGLAPVLQAAIWLQALVVLLYANWGERRVSRLYFLAAWLFASLATMGKGPAGLVIPIVVVLLWVFVARRPKDLLRMEVPSGLLVFLAVGLPWFVAMYARHGAGFTDRLLFHDMVKRAFSHVHDTNEGDDTSFRFYVWQLGYAMFPWTGLVGAAVAHALGRDHPERDTRSSYAHFFVLWLVVTFALFSAMPTKFHHYILPLLPAAAALTGVLLDRLADASERARSGLFHAASGLAAACVVALVGRDMAWSVDGRPSQVRLWHLVTYNYKRPWPETLDFGTTFWVFTLLATIVTLGLVFAKTRAKATFALGAVAIAFCGWALDVYFVKTSPHWSQRSTVLAYHRVVHEAPGPLVAYQMNWKGENFYTGNAIPAFVSSGKKFTQWIDEQKKKGIRSFYFVTEPRRVGTLTSELGSPRLVDKLTDTTENNKFILVRVRFE
jgi:4-amino-4-deoxy-L-arabinose transferase-like glycosyltransferase